MMYNYMFS